MVCKEEVIKWFQRLHGARRIDVMCGLLNMCLPAELRFLGTFVEDLAKKDYAKLRDPEHKANTAKSVLELQTLGISDDRTRRKLNLCLALLHANSYECAGIAYDMLASLPQEFRNTISATSETSVNEKGDTVLDELMLSYVMGLYHPAFTLEQKIIFNQMLRWLSSFSKDLGVNDNSDPTCIVGLEQNLPVVPASPVFNPKLECGTIPVCTSVHANNTMQESPRVIDTPSPKMMEPPVLVSSLKVCYSSQTRRNHSDRITEYSVQATFNNGETRQLKFNYEYLQKFHIKLVTSWSNGTNYIPNIPIGNVGHPTPTGKAVEDYLYKIAVSSCEEMRSLPCVAAFFQFERQTRSVGTSSPAPPCGKVVHYGPPRGVNNPPPKEEVCVEVEAVPSKTQKNKKIAQQQQQTTQVKRDPAGSPLNAPTPSHSPTPSIMKDNRRNNDFSHKQEGNQQSRPYVPCASVSNILSHPPPSNPREDSPGTEQPPPYHIHQQLPPQHAPLVPSALQHPHATSPDPPSCQTPPFSPQYQNRLYPFPTMQTNGYIHHTMPPIVPTAYPHPPPMTTDVWAHFSSYPPPNTYTHNTNLPTLNSKKSCFNCGGKGHRGLQCKEQTIEDISHAQYRIKYSTSSQSNSKPED